LINLSQKAKGHPHWVEGVHLSTCTANVKNGESPPGKILTGVLSIMRASIEKILAGVDIQVRVIIIWK
jgi:hypothetical protein